MGKIIILVWIAAAWFAFACFIISKVKNEKIQAIIAIIITILAIFGLVDIAQDLFKPEPKQIEYKTSISDGRGCCSYHSGVCGCSNGNAKCCDGSISTTCKCGF